MPNSIHFPEGTRRLADDDEWQNRFEVTSTSSGNKYIIAQRRSDLAWGCSCRGWTTHRKCKHLRAAGLPADEWPFQFDQIYFGSRLVVSYSGQPAQTPAQTNTRRRPTQIEWQDVGQAMGEVGRAAQTVAESLRRFGVAASPNLTDEQAVRDLYRLSGQPEPDAATIARDIAAERRRLALMNEQQDHDELERIARTLREEIDKIRAKDQPAQTQAPKPLAKPPGRAVMEDDDKI